MDPTISDDEVCARPVAPSAIPDLHPGRLARYWRLRDALAECWAVLRLARASLGVGLVAVLLVALPAQSREALLVMAEDSARAPWALRWPLIDPAHLPLLHFLLATAVLGWLAADLSRAALQALAPDAAARPGGAGQVARLLPAWCGTAPILAIAFAVADVGRGVDPATVASPGAVRLRLWLLAAALGVAAVAQHRYWRRARTGQRFAGTAREAAVLVLLWGLVLLAPQLMPAGFLRTLGPLSFALLMLALWVPPATGLVIFGERARLPLFWLLGGAAVAFSALDWNDNHALRRTAPAPGAAGRWSPPGIQAWLRGRPEHPSAASPDPYPVYVVAAEGGGLRAAYWTATVLTAIQDRCPAFAHHVYAISGVSGGAVGAAVFAAIVRQEELAREAAVRAGTLTRAAADSRRAQCNVPVSGAGPLQRRADRVLRNDLLTPVLPVALGPDLLQRFFPLPVGPFDRARALERALEGAWRDATETDLMAAPLGALWPPATADSAPGDVPLLLLNTTDVASGEPWTVDQIPAPDPRASELRLSTAAVLSARFPGITPAALAPPVAGSDGRASWGPRRFVDGGYFDNSGASVLLTRLQSEAGETRNSALSATLHEEEREEAAALRPVPYEIIFIRIGTVGTPAGEQWRGLGELLSPMRAVTNGRTARGTMALDQLERYVDRPPIVAGSARVVPFLLCDARARVPLGWLLSERSRRAMQTAVTDTLPCNTAPDAPPALAGNNAETLRELITRFGFILSTH